MRHVVLTVFVLASVPSLALAQSPEGDPWAKKLFQGVIAHDFGSVPRGAQLKYSFPIKNIYAVPLEITNVRVTCGCVTATPSTKTLQPHETGTLDISMDGRRFTGAKTVTVYVSVGPEYISTAALRVSANTRADVVLNPGEINFGVVPTGQAPTQIIDVEYAGALDFRITEIVKSAAAPITVTPQELYRQPPTPRQAGKVGYRLAVTLKSDAPAGSFKQELILKTNDPGSPVLPVVVEGNVQASLTVSPGLVRMGTLKAGSDKILKVTVRGDRPFSILAVDGQGDGLTADLPTRPAQLHQLTLRCHPDQTGELRKQLLIRTDLNDNATAAVTVEANVVP
jgi:Protein of unknown function (DUF1573)